MRARPNGVPRHPGSKFNPKGAVPQQHPLESVPDIRVSASFEGPLPPPTLLRGYNDIVPGLAETISENWLKESEFRKTSPDCDGSRDSQTRSDLWPRNYGVGNWSLWIRGALGTHWLGYRGHDGSACNCSDCHDVGTRQTLTACTTIGQTAPTSKTVDQTL